MFNNDNGLAIKAFIEYTYEQYDDKCLEIGEKRKKLKDDELKKIIEKEFGNKAIMIQNEPREKMKQILKKALEIEGVTTRQLSRVTGISTNIIWKL